MGSRHPKFKCKQRINTLDVEKKSIMKKMSSLSSNNVTLRKF